LGILKSAIRSALGEENVGAKRMVALSQRIRQAFQDPMLDAPIPLLDPDRSLLILWSAKSACSLLFVWHLKTVGLLDDYRASGCPPHEYRGTRYLQSDVFVRGRERVLDDYRVLHVIRDPCLRAVSCYRHVLAFKFADKRFKTFRGGDLDRRRGFSFSRYLDFLGTLDLSRTNIHHRQQLHRVESLKPADRVINISKGGLFQDLNRLEEELGTPRTDFSELGGELRREEGRKAKTIQFAEGSVPDHPFDAAAAAGRGPWPDYGQFLTPSVRRRIERLYAADFEAFAAYL